MYLHRSLFTKRLELCSCNILAHLVSQALYLGLRVADGNQVEKLVFSQLCVCVVCVEAIATNLIELAAMVVCRNVQ